MSPLRKQDEPPERRINALEAENADLRHQLAELRKAFSDAPVVYPRQWGLTPRESALLSTLMTHKTLPRSAAMALLYAPGADDEPGVKIIDVWVSKIRRKTGLPILNVHGVGYRLADETKTIIAGHLAAMPDWRTTLAPPIYLSGQDGP